MFERDMMRDAIDSCRSTTHYSDSRLDGIGNDLIQDFLGIATTFSRSDDPDEGYI